MRTLLLSILLLFSASSWSASYCLKTTLGDYVCPPPFGHIYADKLGKPLCGKGQCIEDQQGNYQCSKQDGGFAIKTQMGDILCTGGCEPASEKNCQIPKP
ncbi:hypothetical protein VT25_17195 [Photobacterium leiognathi subsp. mandapamensis]|nr:hypothetical protein VT25_17195 [Photobacterium leiognathi subsp. mandapamensis]